MIIFWSNLWLSWLQNCLKWDDDSMTRENECKDGCKAIIKAWAGLGWRWGADMSVQDLNEETFEVPPTLRIQGVFQGHVVLFQVHVLHRLQVNLWGWTQKDGVKQVLASVHKCHYSSLDLGSFSVFLKIDGHLLNC